MVIPIETSKEDLFKYYLLIVNTILGDKKLSNTEIEVLARLLLVDHIYRHLPNEDRNLLIFHSKTRNQILLDIANYNPNFSKAVFNNTITSLKKKNILIGNKRDLKLNFSNPIAKSIEKIKNKQSFKVTFDLYGQNFI
jgi:hypothetical protein